MRVLLTIFIINCIWRNIAYCAAPSEEDLSSVPMYYPDKISCTTPTEYVKCARLPTASYNSLVSSAEYAHITAGTVIDEINWVHFRNGMQITGYATNINVTSTSMGNITLYQTHATCVVTEPFVATFSVLTGRSKTTYNGAQACTTMTTTVGLESTPADAYVTSAQAHDGDVCPDGFFTVPYESWCGDGMVNIADTPYCNDDASGEYCLMKLFQPCTAGISAIKTSTGLSFPLYAEKYTEPSVAVMYNNITCYSNLEIGQSSNTININYNGTIYHLTN